MPFTGYPDRKDVPRRHTDKAPTPSRTSPDGGATKTAGMMAEVANDQGPIPRARVPVGMVHHPAGTSRATGQAEADHSSEETAAAGPAPGHSLGKPEDRRRLARETHAAGKDAERGAGRSHIKLLRQVASGASSETNFSPSGGSNPNRRRSLGFLTSTDHPSS